jgi:initiation factor 1A
MVKNTTGGTGAKSLARKHQFNKSENKLRLPEESLEQLACVTKMLGNGMCEIYTNDNARLIGHIRNKFRGKQKRNNLITPNSIILVGLREWENPVKNCDVLEMYDDNQVEQLKQIPNLKIDNILQKKFNGTFQTIKVSNDVDFIETIDEELCNLVGKQRVPEKFEIDTVDEVDIDDI